MDWTRAPVSHRARLIFCVSAGRRALNVAGVLKYLDLTLPTPAENLACDEALLDWCEADGSAQVLRFWESPEYFVVVGYANKVDREVNVEACAANNVPVLRRCSGGGTVLQGPGCLNYSLVLGIEGPLQSITEANCFIMKRNAGTLGALLKTPVDIQGFTDLAVRNLKFSGNSQRRKRHHLLFHGTFLLDFDVARVERFLAPPSKQPAYRNHRAHADFLAGVALPPNLIKRALQEAWDATEPWQNNLQPLIDRLVEGKYGRDEWNRKW